MREFFFAAYLSGMKSGRRKCKFCGEEFYPSINHPGLIDVCLDEECQISSGIKEVDRLTACVSYFEKTIEIKITQDPSFSKKFNRERDRSVTGGIGVVN